MESEELEKQLAAAKKLATSKADELERVLSKNEELLTETKQAKQERNELRNAVSTLKQQLEDFKASKDLGDENMQKVNDLVAQKLEIKQAEFEAQLEESKTQFNEVQQQYTDLRQRYDQERIGSALRKAAEQAGVIPSAIDDVISRANGVFSLSDDNTIEARDKDGNLIKVGKQIMSPEVFVENLKETAGHFWPTSQGSGAQGANGRGITTGPNPFAKETLDYTAQARLMKADPKRAEQLRAQAQG